MKKYEMSGKRILIFDSVGDLADKIQTNIAGISLTSPPEIEAVRTTDEVVKSINRDGYALFIVSREDYDPGSFLGKIVGTNSNAIVISSEEADDTVRVLNKIAGALGCSCSCGI